MYKILVVDDDSAVLALVREIFEMKNYQVTTYQEVKLPINSDDFQGFDLILLDIVMPTVDGLQLCRKIREKIKCPIIFISAKATDEDFVEGLQAGADDYMIKPFSPKRLLAKVAAHLRREERNKVFRTSEQTVRELPPITLYLQEKTVCIHGKILPLTHREYDIVELLSSNPKKVYTLQDIYEYVYDFSSDTLLHSIAEYVYQIRAKFSRYGINPIKTIRGVGYRWFD